MNHNSINRSATEIQQLISTIFHHSFQTPLMKFPSMNESHSKGYNNVSVILHIKYYRLNDLIIFSGIFHHPYRTIQIHTIEDIAIKIITQRSINRHKECQKLSTIINNYFQI